MLNKEEIKRIKRRSKAAKILGESCREMSWQQYHQLIADNLYLIRIFEEEFFKLKSRKKKK